MKSVNDCEGPPQAATYCNLKLFSLWTFGVVLLCIIVRMESSRISCRSALGFPEYTAALNVALALLIPYGFHFVLRMDSLRSDFRFPGDRIP